MSCIAEPVVPPGHVALPRGSARRGCGAISPQHVARVFRAALPKIMEDLGLPAYHSVEPMAVVDSGARGPIVDLRVRLASALELNLSVRCAVIPW